MFYHSDSTLLEKHIFSTVIVMPKLVKAFMFVEMCIWEGLLCKTQTSFYFGCTSAVRQTIAEAAVNNLEEKAARVRFASIIGEAIGDAIGSKQQSSIQIYPGLLVTPRRWRRRRRRSGGILPCARRNPRPHQRGLRCDSEGQLVVLKSCLQGV